MKLLQLGVLVSGRGTNLQSMIDAIENGQLDARIALVISDKANAPALERCRKHKVSSLFLEPKDFADKNSFENTLIDQLSAKSVDLICLAGYMRILGKKFIEKFRGKIINIHPSLLPAFPGLDAQKQALDYGVKVTGCTVHFVDEGIDSGAVIAQSTVPVECEDNEISLSKKILEQEHLLYPKVIQWVAENRVSLAGKKVILESE